MFLTIDGLKNILNIFQKSVKEEIAKDIKSLTIEPSNNDIPTVNITGKLPTKKSNIPCTLEYISSTSSFKANIKIKVQGQSSTIYPKKNFAIDILFI